jgi:hypothetical protein
MSVTRTSDPVLAQDVEQDRVGGGGGVLRRRAGSHLVIFSVVRRRVFLCVCVCVCACVCVCV